MTFWKQRIAFFCALCSDVIRTLLSSVFPLRFTPSKSPLVENKIYGNTKRTITIDGTEYIVPSDITLLADVSSSGATAVDLGIVPVSTDDISIRRKHKGTGTATSAYFGVMPSGSVETPRFSFGKYNSSGTKNFGGFNATQVIGSADTDWHTERAYYADGAYYVQRDDDTPIQYTPQNEIEPTLTAYLFARHGTNGVQVYDGEGTYISLVDWKDVNGTQKALIMGAIKNSVVGVYDFVRGLFIAPLTGTLAADYKLPTPDYPLGAKGVGDRTEQLWNPLNKLNAFITASAGNTVPIQATSAGSKGYWFKIEDGETYALYASLSNRFRIGLATEQPAVDVSVLCIYTTDVSDEHNFTFTNSNNYKYCFVQVCNNDVEPDVFNAVKGSTAPTSYIPYGYKVTEGLNGGSVNLWDKSKSTTDWINGSGNVVPYPNGSAQMSDYVECEAGDTFTICGFRNGTAFLYPQMEITWFTSAKTFIKRSNFLPLTIPYGTATAPNNSAYCKFGFYNQADTSVITDDPMAVRGTTHPTQYEPYFAQTYTAIISSPLQQIGTYTDSINFADGAGARNVGVKVFDGTEDFVKDRRRYYHVLTEMLNEGPARSANIFCTHFKTSITGTQGDIFKCDCEAYIYPDMTLYPDATAFKAYLATQYAAGTPLMVWYPLAIPTTESITPVPVNVTVGQENTIEPTNTVLPSQMEIKYWSN